MENITKRYIVLITILLVTSLLVLFLSYDTFYKADAAVQRVSNIPLRLDGWVGRDIPLDQRVYRILETKSILNRSYVKDGRSVFLSLVYYPETKVDFHAPEACLAGRGTRVSKAPQRIYITCRGRKIGINVNKLIRRQQGSEELFFYFYKAGNFVGNSYIRLRLNLALNKFKSGNKSGSLIRVSTPVRNDDYQTASTTLTRFIQDMYPYLVKYL